MQCCVAAALNPLAVVLRIEITDAQRAMRRSTRPIRFDVGDETNERSIAFEDHVELPKLVALHTIRAFRVDLVPIHVTVDAFNRDARAFEVAEPVFSVRRTQRRGIFVDEGLNDALDVCFDRGAISGSIVLSLNSKGQSGESKKKKEGSDYAWIHRRDLQMRCDATWYHHTLERFARRRRDLTTSARSHYRARALRPQTRENNDEETASSCRMRSNAWFDVCMTATGSNAARHESCG